MKETRQTKTKRAKKSNSAPRKRQSPSSSKSKTQVCIALLKRSNGATISEMQRALGWQEHSIRGFLAGTVKKIPDIDLVSNKPVDGPRRYRIVATGN